MSHISVLTDELIDGLALTPDATVVDCTFGSGGHAEAILAKLGADGTYIGIDLDPAATAARDDLVTQTDATVHLVTANFRNIRSVLETHGNVRPDVIVADLGWRMSQFAKGNRGFSFQTDEPLAMTYGDPDDYTFTAYDIANEWEEDSIVDILHGYGEERFAKRIARAIVTARTDGKIKTSRQLAEIVRDAVPSPFRNRGIHPATKTFQAFRIAVNDELGALSELLSQGFTLLRSRGRFGIISFHSLEDRLVKRSFRAHIHDHQARQITKKPITASDDELATNPRARSAKLRIIEKI